MVCLARVDTGTFQVGSVGPIASTLSTKKFFVDGSQCANVFLREMHHIHFQAFSILRPLVATAIDAAKSAPTFLQNRTRAAVLL